MNKPRNFQRIFKDHVSISGLKWLFDHRKITKNGNFVFIQIGFTTRVYPHFDDESTKIPDFRQYDYIVISGFNEQDTKNSIEIVLNDNHTCIEPTENKVSSLFMKSEEQYASFVKTWQNEKLRQKKWKLHIDNVDPTVWNFIDSHFTIDNDGIIEYNKNCFIVLNKKSNPTFNGKDNIPNISIVGDNASVVNWVYISLGKISSKKNRKEIGVKKTDNQVESNLSSNIDQSDDNISYQIIETSV